MTPFDAEQPNGHDLRSSHDDTHARMNGSLSLNQVLEFNIKNELIEQGRFLFLFN